MSRGFILIIVIAIVLLLASCGSKPRNIYFYSTDLLPAPFPGIVFLPPEKPRSRILRREITEAVEVDICSINYTDKQTELQSKLECLIKSSP